MTGKYHEVNLSELLNTISPNPFQRVLNRERVKIIITGLLEEKARFNYPTCVQTGIIQIAHLNNNYHIIDGQHRLEAYKAVKEPQKIQIQIWQYNNLDDMLKKFRDINSNTQIQEHEMDAAKPGASIQVIQTKDKFGILEDYVQRQYSQLISESPKPQWPNINIGTFRKLMKYMEELKDSTPENITYIFEQFNGKLREKMLKGIEDDKKRIIKSDNERKPPLYINRYLTELLKKHAVDLG